MKTFGTFLASAALALAALSALASPVAYPVTLTDSSGNNIAGATWTISSTALTPGTAATGLTGDALASASSVTGASVTEYDKANGYYTFVYDPAVSGEAHFTATATKTGTTFPNGGVVHLTFTLDSSAVAGTSTRVTTALPAIAPGASGGLPTGDASGRVLLQPSEPGVTIPTVTLVGTLTTYTGNTPQTGDAFARLGAPVGASLAADIAAVKASVGTPQQTGSAVTLPTAPTGYGPGGTAQSGDVYALVSPLIASSKFTTGALSNAPTGSGSSSVTDSSIQTDVTTALGASGYSPALATALGVADTSTATILTQTNATNQQANVQAGLTAQGLTSAIVQAMAAQVARIYGVEWGNVTQNGSSYSITMPGGALTIPAAGATVGTVTPVYDSSGKLTTQTKTVN